MLGIAELATFFLKQLLKISKVCENDLLLCPFVSHSVNLNVKLISFLLLYGVVANFIA